MPRVLSFQAAYACRHSGACCAAGWIEPLDDGRCRHFDGHRSGGCTIQRARGHSALPHACQQFPRVATLSPLGVSVTLSAYCPTAASLLFSDEPFSIVDRADLRSYEGLDARNVLPPLLRPGMLMDWDAVARWEELTIATLSGHRHDVDRALSIIEGASRDVCGTWTPKDGPLAHALDAAFGARRPADKSDVPDADPNSAPIARYFAAHAFACWPMYDGRGIDGALDHLRETRQALDTFGEVDLLDGFRQADLRLRHKI